MTNLNEQQIKLIATEVWNNAIRHNMPPASLKQQQDTLQAIEEVLQDIDLNI